ncbi:unnamed protein product [Polarella glacialis]|uniref:Calmodulin-lysine N-methyltransferase n=1 Tax=Polarella glacialis TaxID=89957 RepID=A0A813IDE8_POLGL|nr:unnamed protein product [Polarella glacialis]
MDALAIDRGNCCSCGQGRILGHWLAAETFRCCACLDEYGDQPLEKTRANCKAAFRRPGKPANWWASREPPQKLADVPEGFLASTTWWTRADNLVDPGRKSRNCSQPAGEASIVSVTDPAHHYFTGHGAERVWEAGLALAWHLSLGGQGLPLSGTDLRVLELGAGCGMPGIALARQGASVTLTDVPWLLRLCHYNVEANFRESDERRPKIATLRWGNPADVAKVFAGMGGPPDLVLGADLVYREDDFDVLLATIAALGAHSTLLTISRRDNAVIAVFLQKLASQFWHVQSCGILGNSLLMDLRLPTADRKAAARAVATPGSLAAAAA